MTQAKCFKCEKPIEVAMKEPEPDDYWEMPCGIHFRGGGNYGSTIYDTLVDGKQVELLVCDDCLRKHKEMLRTKDACENCKFEERSEDCEDCWLDKTHKEETIAELKKGKKPIEIARERRKKRMNAFKRLKQCFDKTGIMYEASEDGTNKINTFTPEFYFDEDGVYLDRL